MQNANLPGQLFQKKARSRLGCLGQLLVLGLILVGVGLLYAVLTPWAFFMGGNFHPLGSWAGWGVMKSKTAGNYLLFVRISPAIRGHQMFPAWDVKGTGYLCTPKGERFTLKLGGDMPRKFWVNSLGQPVHLWMDNWRVTLPIGAQRRPYIRIDGHWAPSEVIGDDHKSISGAFLPDGTLRPHGSYPSASQTELIPVTLHEGSYSSFEAACRASRH
jgi:hypothetical protein